MVYTIEKGVPMPAGSKSTTGLAATLRRLEVGDSFVCDKTDGTIRAAANQVRIKVAIRKHDGGGYRVWRKA